MMFRLSPMKVLVYALLTCHVSADIAPPPDMRKFFIMDKATVRIHLKPSADGGVTATVEAEFDMLPKFKQSKGKTRKFTISFPVASKKNPTKVLHFSATVNGAKQIVHPFSSTRAEEKKKLQTSYMWLCQFNNGIKNKVSVKYQMELPKDDAKQHILFYSLTSGAKWAGKIGLETVRLTADKGLSLSPMGNMLQYKKTPSGARLWTVTNSDPEEDIVVHVTNSNKAE
jgi:hypothetical protein